MKTFSTILVALGFVLLTCSVAEENSAEENGTTVTTVATITPTVMSSGSVMPTPTASPFPNPSFETSNFHFKDNNKTCFAMTAAFQVNLTYTVDGKNKTVYYNMGKEGVVNTSMSTCNSTALQANITINRNADQDPAFYITFYFSGDAKEEHWKISSIHVTIDTEYLQGYEPTGLVVFSALTDEITDTYVEFKRSFKCSAKEVVNFNTSNSTIKIVPVLTVENFRVQVFRFDNATTGDFGKVRLCSMDANKGNKIVPIAVGAALAGLVIVVLIAYLIGRLRSRRQSSYEALS